MFGKLHDETNTHKKQLFAAVTSTYLWFYNLDTQFYNSCTFLPISRAANLLTFL